jgi:hypothetical protein
MTAANLRTFTTAIVTLAAAWGGVSLLATAANAATTPTPTTTVTTTTPTTPTTPITTTTPTTPTNPGTVDTASDLAALGAYRGYLQALVTGATAARASEQLFVNTTASTCEGALTPVMSMSRSSVNGAALTALGQEIGSDLWLSFTSTASEPFTQLATTLAELHWTHRTTTQAVAAFVKAEHTVLTMLPSNLCKDALLLAAKPLVEPDTAKSFLLRYQTARTTLKARLTTFLAVLERFQTPAEAKLVSSIDKLASQFDALALSAQNSSASLLLTDLGI